MSVGQPVVSLVVLTFLWTVDGANAVDCVLTESCILPCSFQAGDDVLIQWNQLRAAGQIPVHSYYNDQDHFNHQDRRFRGRTSLFQDQISRGNASLRLTAVEIEDEDRYQCYTSTVTGKQETDFNLKVHAPVRKVDIQQEGTTITCSSEGIYPEPGLTWSTDPPSNATPPDKPSVRLTDQQLYDISSSLTASDPHLDYSCTVTTGRNTWKTTLFHTTSISGSSTKTTIPCRSTNPRLTLLDLVWRFNHSDVILKQSGGQRSVSEGWRQRVEGESASGSLTLQHSSSQQDGFYTCEVSDGEETNVTNTLLRIQESPSPSQGIVAAVVVPVVVGAVVVVVVVAATVFMLHKKKKRTGNQRRQLDVEMPLNDNQGEMKRENNGTTTPNSDESKNMEECDRTT